MGHPVDNLSLTCIDFRFRALIAEWIKHNLNDQSDIVALAGASMAVLNPDWQATTLTQIELAKQLHDIKTVHIIDHIDCGAYGGSAKFEGDKEAEVAMHHTELAKASQTISARFPTISVETHIIDFDGMV